MLIISVQRPAGIEKNVVEEFPQHALMPFEYSLCYEIYNITIEMHKRIFYMVFWVCFASCKINPKNSVCHKAYIKDINEYIYLYPEVETTYKYGYDSLYRHVLQRLNESSIKMDRYKSLRASFVVQAIISKRGYPVFFSIVKTGSKDAKKTELKSLSTIEIGEVEKVVINSLYELKDWTPARCKNNQVTSRVLIPFRLNLQ